MAGALRDVRPAPPDRGWVAEAGLLVVAASLFVAAGPIGLAVGVIVYMLSFVSAGPYVVAAGHVLALAVAPPDLGAGLLVALEAGFLAVLAGPSITRRYRLRSMATVGLSAFAFGGLAWVGWWVWRPHYLVGLSLVTAVAIGLYGAHRYSVVLLETAGVERQV